MRPYSIAFRFDLGLTQLVPCWREMLRPAGLGADLLAGVTVACVALPLSLAIAIATEAPPSTGIITAVVAGIVCALLGGSSFAVSGPAAAMTVLLASIIEDHGYAGMLLSALLAATLQIVTGVLGLGAVVKLVPLPVVLGFTAGIGTIIAIGQLPIAFGLPPTDQAHILNVLVAFFELLHHAHPETLLMSAGTLLLIFGLPRLNARIPAHLIAVAACTAVASWLDLDVATLGEIPRILPTFAVPDLARPDWKDLVGNAFAIWALGSLESLLSCGATDRLARARQPHDANQELIGQGLGNVAATLLGGLPATSVIARSALNVQAGARTRRAALFHALFVGLAVWMLAPAMAAIPLSALAGVMLAVAIRMLDLRELTLLWRLDRSEAALYLLTFFAMISFDLVAGVQAGLVAAAVIAAIRLGRLRAELGVSSSSGPGRLDLSGPLTFLAPQEIARLRGRIHSMDPVRGIVIDLSRVPNADSSGADALYTMISDLRARGFGVALLHANESVRAMLVAADGTGVVSGLFAVGEAGALAMLGSEPHASRRDRVLQGVQHFRSTTMVAYRGLFAQLASAQNPHSMFITCSDSRVTPTMIVCTDPGELFVHRNIGNIVPPWAADRMPAEGAGVEYAVGVLGVRNIIVCGHSGCGAMAAVMHGGIPKGLGSVLRWLDVAGVVKSRLPPDASLEAAARANVLMQVENLRSYPLVRDRIARGELTLYGWYIDIGRGEVDEWNEESGCFAALPEPEAVHEAHGHGVHHDS